MIKPLFVNIADYTANYTSWKAMNQMIIRYVVITHWNN